MLSYLDKFKKLDKSVRDKISTPEVMEAVVELEKKYELNLAADIIKVAVGDISIENLGPYLASAFKLEPFKAEALAEEMKEKVFFSLGDYLGLKPSVKAKEPIRPEPEKETPPEPLTALKKPDAKMEIEEPDPELSLPAAKPVSKIAPPPPAIPEVNSLKIEPVFKPEPVALPETAENTPEASGNPDNELKIEPIKKTGSDFYFSAEDEEEAKEIAKKLKDFSLPTQKTEQEKKIEEVFTALNLNLGSEDLHNRLKQILKTYANGIRSRVDAKQSVMKPIDRGGLAMDEAQTDKIFFIADKILKKDEAVTPAQPDKKIFLPEDEAGQEASVPKAEVKNEAGEKQESLGEEIIPLEPLNSQAMNISRSEVSQELEKTGLRDAGYDFKDLPEANKEPLAQEREAEAAAAADKDFYDLDKSGTIEEESSLPAETEEKLEAVSLDELVEEEINNENLQEQEKDIDLKKQAGPEDADEQEKAGEADLSFEQSANEKNQTSDTAIVLEEIEKESERVEPEKKKKEEKAKPNSYIIMERGVRAPTVEGKIRMDDVKYIPKTMGPIDELNAMDLVNFRRLGDKPEDRVEKIIAKFDFLEKDSYAKRLEGIAGWRKSPLNRLYLDMANECIVHNFSIDEAIENRIIKDQAYLTKEEFNAIMILSKAIRF